MGKYDPITNIKASSCFSDYYQNGTWHRNLSLNLSLKYLPQRRKNDTLLKGLLGLSLARYVSEAAANSILYNLVHHNLIIYQK